LGIQHDLGPLTLFVAFFILLTVAVMGAGMGLLSFVVGGEQNVSGELFALTMALVM
jgi:hypothetical protein